MGDVSKATLSEQIYNILKKDIINQTLKSGEKITLKSLIERFSTSSTPIREAMTRLYQDKLLEYCSNVGGKVISFTQKDIEEIYDFYMELDCIALKMAMENYSAEDLCVKLKDTLDKCSEAIESGDAEAFSTNSDLFHDVFYQCAGNSRLMDAATRVRNQFGILANIYQNYSINISTIHKEHEGIYEAVCQNNTHMACSLMQEHFHHGKDYLIANINKQEGLTK
jgi:DNA-binding GntR family transcriptional regulator